MEASPVENMAAGRPAKDADSRAVTPPGLEAWPIEIECFRCGRSFGVAYKFLRAGTVLRCPTCRGSYLVRAELESRVSRVLAEIHRRVLEKCEPLQDRPAEELSERWQEAVKGSAPLLRKIVAGVRPPGAPHNKAGGWR